MGKKSGNIVELESGRILGQHQGYWFHTIGQRKGLGLSGGPWFVVKKDLDANVVFVSHDEHHLQQARRDFRITNLNWISGTPPESPNLSCKLRHGPRTYECSLEMNHDTHRVFLDEADAGIAPGQFCVFYQGKECLGAGVIC